MYSRIKKSNPVIFKTIINSYKKDRLSHAYLFIDNNTADVMAIVNFLVEIIISKDPLNGEIRRISSYADINFIDGNESLIKKELISEALLNLSETSLEDNAPKILVIRNIENMNKYSANSLLKFLEEPTNKTYLIMTTNNEHNIINTILSRCQIMRVIGDSTALVIKSLMENNSTIDKETAAIFANIYSNSKMAQESFMANGADVVSQIIDMIETSIENKHIDVFNFSQYISKENYFFVFEIISLYLRDVIRQSQGFPTIIKSSKSKMKLLNKNDILHKAIIIIDEFLMLQERPINFELQKNKLIIELKECFNV